MPWQNEGPLRARQDDIYEDGRLSYGGAAAVTPVSLVAHAGAYNPGGGPPGVTGAVDTSGAKLLVAACAGVFGSQGTLTDNLGNAWTALTEYQAGAGNFSIQLRYVANPTVGAGHTFSIAGANTAIAVAAFNQILAVLPFDAQNGAGQASATTQQPGSITPSQANELIVTGFVFNDAVAPGSSSIDSGFTITDNVANIASGVAAALAYKVQAAALPVNPTWSSGVAADRIAAAIASFKHA